MLPFYCRCHKINLFSNIRGQAESKRTKNATEMRMFFSGIIYSITLASLFEFHNKLLLTFTLLVTLELFLQSSWALFNFMFMRHLHMWHCKIWKHYVCIRIPHFDPQINYKSKGSEVRHLNLKNAKRMFIVTVCSNLWVNLESNSKQQTLELQSSFIKQIPHKGNNEHFQIIILLFTGRPHIIGPSWNKMWCFWIREQRKKKINVSCAALLLSRVSQRYY